jgi:hypothetical protein
MTMGAALVEVITAGRKRTFADITEETGIILNDGRKGTYKPSKYECSHLFERTSD